MTSEQIKNARKLLGLSQPKFADEIGVKLRTIQYIESGKTECRKMHALAIECVLRRAKLWKALK